jgi:1-deoxy-D-xylulose-5-phosphate synthase
LALMAQPMRAAADELELKHMVATAASIDDRPSAFRYPRGEGIGLDLNVPAQILDIGKGRIVREGSKIAILSLGTRLAEALKAADLLMAHGLSTTVADARFAKPIDKDLLCQLARNHEVLITLEEGAMGGFATQVFHVLEAAGILDKGIKIRPMMLPDRLIDHDTPARQYEEAGLTAIHILAQALDALGIRNEMNEIARLAS